MTIGRTEDFSLADSSADFPAKTERLTLVHSTRVLADAEANDRTHFSALLNANVPENWPPQIVVAPDSGDGSNWKTFYLTHMDNAGGQSVLVGLAGLKQWPSEHRTIQIGAVLLPEYFGHRLGEEVVAALAHWGVSQPDVDLVICDIPNEHFASRKSLERAGFSEAATAPSNGFARFRLTRKEGH